MSKGKWLPFLCETFFKIYYYIHENGICPNQFMRDIASSQSVVP